MEKRAIRILFLITIYLISNHIIYASIGLELTKHPGIRLEFKKIINEEVKEESLYIVNLSKELLVVYSNFSIEFINLSFVYRKWKRLGRPDNAFHLQFDYKVQTKEEIDKLKETIFDSIYVYTESYSIEKVEMIELARKRIAGKKGDYLIFCDYIIVLPSKYSGLKEVYFASIPDYDKDKKDDYIKRFVKLDRRTFEERLE